MIRLKKITYLILILLLSTQFMDAQESSYTLNCPSQNLKKTLDQISDKYDLELAYPTAILHNTNHAALKISTSNLNTFLNEVLQSHEIEYQIMDDGKVLLRKVSNYRMEEFEKEESFVLEGYIIDINKSTPLEYAAVAIPNKDVGTYTDAQGKFALEINNDWLEEDVLITYVGYEDVKFRLEEILNQKIISLETYSESISEVTIGGVKPAIIVDRLSPNTGLKFNNLLGIGTNTIQANDILRKLQFLPGIGVTDDKNSAIKIRGADESETLVMIDGIPVYKTDHFYGIFSNINGNYIEDVTLYKNEIPINYSGKSGGMVSMNSLNKVNGLKGGIYIDLLNSSINLAYPIAKNWTINIAGRASYQNVAKAGFFETDNNFEFFESGQVDLNRSTVLGIVPSFDFYDMNGKVAFQSDQFSFNANFFKSSDNLNSAYENSFQTGNRGNPRINIEESFSNKESWANDGASINFNLKLKNNWTVTSNSYLTQFEDSGDLNISLTDDKRNNPLNREAFNARSNFVRDISSTVMVSKDISDTKVSVGLATVHHENRLNLQEDNLTILAGDNTSIEHGAFASVVQKIDEKLILNGGLRANYYDKSDKFYFSPQASASYIIDNHLSLKTSYSINYQYVREISYSSRFGEEIELFVLSDANEFSVGNSASMMIGGTFKQNGWLIDLEAYKINREHVLGFTTFLPRLLNNLNPNNDDVQYRILDGEGSTIGADLLVSYQSKAYKGMMSYTLSESLNNFKAIQKNKPFSTQDDRRHQFSMINTYRYKEFEFSMNAVYGSGRKYTDLSILNMNDDRRNNPKNFQQTLPDYKRIDLGAAYSFDLASYKAIVEFSVLNLFDTQNVKYQQYTSLIPINGNNNQLKESVLGTQTSQLGRTFNVSVGMKF